MRLDKLLASSGFGSRKDVKKLVKARAVTVNGELAKQVKDHVDPSNDEVLVHGERVEYKEFIYLMMNKPDGVISATEDVRDETVVDLLEPEDIARSHFLLEGWIRTQSVFSFSRMMDSLLINYFLQRSMCQKRTKFI